MPKRRSKDKGRAHQSQPPGKVRIIAGRWRGRRLEVPDLPGLRPTGDRVRETLFNWLQPWLPGSRCLDLFAGTGALGFEAASRGAARVTLVEREPSAAAKLAEHVQKLDAEGIEVVCDDAMGWLERCGALGFDIVFLDPPFESSLGEAVMPKLARLVAPDGWLYLEQAAEARPLAVPAGFNEHRAERFGGVSVRLLRRLPN